MSSTGHSVSSPNETPRSSSKILRGASYFQLPSWCFIWWWITASLDTYYLKNKENLTGKFGLLYTNCIILLDVCRWKNPDVKIRTLLNFCFQAINDLPAVVYYDNHVYSRITSKVFCLNITLRTQNNHSWFYVPLRFFNIDIISSKA